MPSFDPLDIMDEVSRRGITRLCHFTHLSSFRQIVDHKAVLSTQVLVRKRLTAAVNDRQRLDGHLDYIPCSLTFPNLWVLDAYRERGHRTDEWVVLLLKKMLLWQPSAKFSPVNAATAFGAHEALELLTIRGAEAIGMADRVGSLEVGKAADLVVHDLSSVGSTPAAIDPALQLLWAGDGRAVTDVIVDGVAVLQDGVSTKVDHRDLVSEAKLAQRKLFQQAGLSPSPRWPVR